MNFTDQAENRPSDSGRLQASGKESGQSSDGSQTAHLLQASPPPLLNPNLILAPDIDRAVIEEFKKLKSVVLRLTKGEIFRNAIAVISGSPAEGKSLTSMNLALSLAQAYDHTVLLVDTDLRSPTIHRLLGLEPKVGLIHCLLEGVPLNEALIKTGLGKLVILPAGGMMSDPAELLASDKMAQLMAELKGRYPDRYVIYDTPPLLAYAESQVIASRVDGVLLVVREGGTRKFQLGETLSLLQGINLLGTVYNGDTSLFRKRTAYYYYR